MKCDNRRNFRGWLRRSSGTLFWVFVTPLIGFAQPFEVDSGFSTAETVVGRSINYSITIRKSPDQHNLVLESPAQPELPRVAGLTFGRFQTREQYLSTSGSDPVGVTLAFEVVADEEGRIVMPAFEIPYMGQRLQVPATSIRVRSPSSSLSGEEVEWFFFELENRPDSLHVGQRFKTSLNLYVFRGLRNVTFSSPAPVGSDFSLDAISPGPTERVATRGLYRYSVYSWPLTFRAVRSGRISVGFKLDLNFTIPNDRIEFIRAVRANTAESIASIETLLQDSSKESQVIFSKNLNFDVESLPTPGEAASFYNAIGKFRLKTQLEERSLKVGEPVNVVVEIEGEGNFGSLRSPKLPLDKRWRVFSPQEQFEDGDFLGYRGKQIYRYVLIPLSSEISEFPAFAYTYFDVEKRDFVTLRSDPIPVGTVGENLYREEDAEMPAPASEREQSAELSLDSYLRWELGQAWEMQRPFFQRMRFYGIQGVLLMLFAGAIVWKRRQMRIQQDAVFARQLRVESWIRKYTRLAGIAAREEDSEQFYESAFLAFCAVVASINDANVEAITVEDVESRLRNMDLNDNTKRVIEGYLRRYEQHRFSGTVLENPPLSHEFDRLRSILKRFNQQLEKTTKA
ncbi:MAG: hypothetical protein ABQ298_15860 [Puniceicoccaceae bacterium]